MKAGQMKACANTLRLCQLHQKLLRHAFKRHAALRHMQTSICPICLFCPDKEQVNLRCMHQTGRAMLRFNGPAVNAAKVNTRLKTILSSAVCAQALSGSVTYEVNVEQGPEQLLPLGKGAPDLRGGEG